MGDHFKAPLWRSPITDFTEMFGSIRYQPRHQNKCGVLELKYHDCLEAYGASELVKCQDLMADVRECVFQCKQVERVTAMREEQKKQYWFGDRKERYKKGPVGDSYGRV